MAWTVTGATRRELKAVDILKEAKVEELGWGSSVAPLGTPRYNEKASRGGRYQPAAWRGRDQAEVNMPPAGGVQGHLGNR